jgi:dehydrogenase/reductase SDR family protein 4
MSSSGNPGKLNGKIAIVTASTDGIGLSIAKRLVNDGAKVMISSRKQKNVEKALNEFYKSGVSQENLKGIVCHVGNKEDRSKLIQETLSQFGGIDILVSNAAANPHFGPVLECPESSWDKIFEINVKAPFLLTQEVHPHLVERKGGNVVIISSIAAFQPMQLLGAYSVSKTALLGLTKVLSQQLGAENIRVNCICPGVIRTSFSKLMTETPEIHDRVISETALGRVGNPDEIGGIVSFLCSEDASYITGENFAVTGGMQSRL